ncbi:hypothetical protein D3C76_1786560 [compost metagenome]
MDHMPGMLLAVADIAIDDLAERLVIFAEGQQQRAVWPGIECDVVLGEGIAERIEGRVHR